MLRSNERLPFGHDHQAPVEVKRMSMVACRATCEAIDIGLTGTTMEAIGWPYRKVGVGSKINLNDVTTHLPVNDVVILVTHSLGLRLERDDQAQRG